MGGEVPVGRFNGCVLIESNRDGGAFEDVGPRAQAKGIALGWEEKQEEGHTDV